MTPSYDLSNPDDLELIFRYTEGTCTPAERDRVIAALAVDQGLAERIDVLRGARWDTERQLTAVWNTVADAEFARVRTDSTVAPRSSVRRGMTRRENRWIGAIGFAGAAILAALVIRPSPARHVDESQTYATNARQQATVRLSDGTTMTLAPQTTVRLTHFGTASRTVVVDGGEVSFDVAHVEGAPFIVRSGAVTARVLGTTFFVRHDVGTSETRVAVIDGKVYVSPSENGQRSQTLTAHHIADVIDSTLHVSTVDDLVPGTEWVQGKLVFYHVPVATVLATLSRWYGYQFRYTDSTLSQRSVTIAVSMQSSATALATLEQILSVNMVVAGDTVTLAPQVTPAGKGVAPSRNYNVWVPTREIGR